MDHNPFKEWMDRHRFSISHTAKVLGCSRGAVQNWRRVGAPHYILLACAAYSHGLGPVV